MRPHDETKLRKLIASPLYARYKIFTDRLAGISMRKRRLLLNKPVYTGMTIVESSKLLMYDFFYNTLKKQYGPMCQLLYTDRDSFLFEIETEDVYKDIGASGALNKAANGKSIFDTREYSKDHSLHSDTNKKVLG